MLHFCTHSIRCTANGWTASPPANASTPSLRDTRSSHAYPYTYHHYALLLTLLSQQTRCGARRRNRVDVRPPRDGQVRALQVDRGGDDWRGQGHPVLRLRARRGVHGCHPRTDDPHPRRSGQVCTIVTVYTSTHCSLLFHIVSRDRFASTICAAFRDASWVHILLSSLYFAHATSHAAQVLPYLRRLTTNTATNTIIEISTALFNPVI